MDDTEFMCQICNRVQSDEHNLLKTCEECGRDTSTECCMALTACQTLDGVCRECILKTAEELPCSICAQDIKVELSTAEPGVYALDDAARFCEGCKLCPNCATGMEEELMCAEPEFYALPEAKRLCKGCETK